VQGHGKRARENLRIVEPDLDVEASEACASDALSRAQRFAMRMKSSQEVSLNPMLSTTSVSPSQRPTE
jgi:hypothetical protein